MATGYIAQIKTPDSSTYLLKDSELRSEFSDHESNTTIHTTESEKATWNAKYDKPSTGIPKTDLASGVQTSLGLADTAVQDANYVHTDNNYTTTEKNKLAGIASGAEVNQNAFSNIKVGSTTIAADSKTDTLELVAGNNITITPDATNDKLTITSDITQRDPATDTPLMDGIGDVGASDKYAREDHVHPHDIWQLPIESKTDKEVAFRDGQDNYNLLTGKIKIEPYRDGEGIPSTDNIRTIHGHSVINVYHDTEKPKHYGVKWDGESTFLTRTGDAADITTGTINFCHQGSVNPDYDNPFDDLFPWNEVKLCNIDISLYRALSTGQSLKDCVVAWEDDANFSYTHQYGVWQYRPSFYGAHYYDDDDQCHHWDISDKPCAGYIHYAEGISGRWIGCDVILTIDGTSKHCLLPVTGMNLSNVTLANIHTYAKNWGATLDSLYSLDPIYLMYIVEYASWDSQTAIGNGVHDLYRQSSDKVQAASTGTTVKVLAANAAACIVDAIMDFGTSNGGINIGRRYIVARAVDSQDSTILNITLDSAISVNTDTFWSIHGRINVADEQIGSKSGYIGTNGKCDAYYRGASLWANKWRYVLGAYKSTDEHVWIAQDTNEADEYDAINTSVHTDTGVVLASSNGYIGKLGWIAKRGIASMYAFCTQVVSAIGNSFVKDYYYTSPGYNRVLIVGGDATDGVYAGFLCCGWYVYSGRSYWYCGGRPSLKIPLRG